jgi:hypothetical protein
MTQIFLVDAPGIQLQEAQAHSLERVTNTQFLLCSQPS